MGSSDRQAAVAAEGSLRPCESRGVEPLRAVAGIGGDDKMVYVYDAKTFEVKWPLRGHSASVNCVDFSPDGLTIASGSGCPTRNDNSVRVWDVKTGKQLWQLSVNAGIGGVQSVSFSPSGDMVAAGCYNGKMYFVDPTAGEIKSSLNVGSSVRSVAFSVDGTTLAAGCYQKIYFLDPTAGEIKSSLRVDSVCIYYF